MSNQINLDEMTDEQAHKVLDDLANAPIVKLSKIEHLAVQVALNKFKNLIDAKNKPAEPAVKVVDAPPA